jgi:hypothetical protein
LFDPRKMLALESSRQQHFSYFSHDQVPLDSAAMDSFAYQTMPPNMQSLPQSHDAYYDSMYMEQQSADMQNVGFLPNSPPSKAPSHRSGASGLSISSAPSSVIGSPYSGTFPESWTDTSHGLVGFPGTMMNELDYTSVGGVMDAPKFGSGSFVGAISLSFHFHFVFRLI